VVDRVVARELVEPVVAPRFALVPPHHTASHNRFAVPVAPVAAPAVVVLRLPLSHSKNFTTKLACLTCLQSISQS